MAEEAVVATSEAPPVVETPAVVEAPVVDVPAVETPERPSGPMSKKDRERGFRAISKKRAEEIAVEAVVEPEVEVEPAVEPVEPEPVVSGDVEPVVEPVVATEGVVGGAVEGTAVEPVVEPTATPSFVTVPIDPAHPASQGQSDLKFADELSARVFKAYKNSNVKQNQLELESVQAELAKAKEENAKLYDKDDRAEADRAAQEKWKKTPQYDAAVKELNTNRELEADGTIPPGTASAVWEARMMGYQPTVDAEYKTLADARTAERQQEADAVAERKADQWIAAAADRSRRYLPAGVQNHPNWQQWFDAGVDDFGVAIRKNRIANVVAGDATSIHNAFQEFLMHSLMRDPTSRSLMMASRTEKTAQDSAAADRVAADARKAEDLKNQGREEYKAELAARRSDVPPPNPVGNLAGVSRGQTPTAPPDDGQPPSTGRQSKRDREARMLAQMRKPT